MGRRDSNYIKESRGFLFFFADEAGKGVEGEALIAGDGDALVVV